MKLPFLFCVKQSWISGQNRQVDQLIVADSLSAFTSNQLHSSIRYELWQQVILKRNFLLKFSSSIEACLIFIVKLDFS